MRPPNSNRSRGFTLVELLGASSIIIVLANILTMQLVTTARLHRLSQLALDRCEQVEEAGERFRRAAREANGVADQVGPFSTGTNQVVLALPNSADEPSVRRYTVLGAVFEPDRFSVLTVRQSGETFEVETAYTTHLPFEKIEFVVNPNANLARALITLNLSVDTEGTRSTLPVENSFVASLRSTAP